MSDRRDRTSVVAYTGRGTPTDRQGRIRIERVAPDAVADYAPYVDCVLLEEPGGGLRALESLRSATVPTVLYDRFADPVVATEATRLDATEYVTDRTLEERSLADVIAAVVGRRSPAADPATTLAGLRSALADRSLSPHGRIERLLEVGRRRFDLGFGVLAATDGVEYTVFAGDDFDPVPLSETICRATLRTDERLELPNTAWGPTADSLSEPFARLGCYFGDVVVDGDRYGTVWFGDERPRTPLSTDERVLLDLLVELMGAELERTRTREPHASRRSSFGGALASDGSGDARFPTSLSMERPGGPPDDPRSLSGRDGRDGSANPDRYRHLFEQLPDAVVDVEFRDGEPIVRDVNDAFERVFGYDASDALGASLNDLIVPDEHRPKAAEIDAAMIEQRFRTAKVERETATDRRTFLFGGFSYPAEGSERAFGVYTDITDRLEQEQRLRVLHRVLRHNLRNEMTVITGYAELLAKHGPDPEYRSFAERIHEKASEVSKLGEQVRRIEQALDVDRQRVALDPEPLVRSIAERFRAQSPGTTIRVSADSTAEVIADELLETAIENLVENAIEHHPDDPTVEIRLSSVGETWLDIAVSDDGPGIPDREREIVSGDREITQLDHSRGLGLWVSRWVARGVDGRLLFGDTETGAEVTLRLRLADGRTSD